MRAGQGHLKNAPKDDGQPVLPGVLFQQVQQCVVGGKGWPENGTAKEGERLPVHRQ